MLARVAAAAADDDGWARAVSGLVLREAPGYKGRSAAAQQQLYEDFQMAVEENLERLLEAMKIEPEAFLFSLIGVSADALELPPAPRAIAMHVLALDDRAVFAQLVAAEAAAAAHPLRRVAAAAAADGAWTHAVTAWCDAHSADFASSAGGSQLAWSTAHGEYQVALEEQLEDLIGRSGVDAEEALAAIADAGSGDADAPLAALPKAVLLPLQAFVAYEAFEEMMLRAARG